MLPFMSTVTNKIDAKGRVSVPATFRGVVKGEGGSGVVCFPSFSDQAIEGCTMGQIAIFSEIIDALPPFSEERDALAASILGQSHDLSFDSEGRIKLPQELLEHADINGEVMFVGLGRKFQIWSPAIRSETDARRRELARVNRSRLSFTTPSLQGGRDE
jgi:MraZ protein